jgi:hypothetical protein
MSLNGLQLVAEARCRHPRITAGWTYGLGGAARRENRDRTEGRPPMRAQMTQTRPARFEHE